MSSIVIPNHSGADTVYPLVRLLHKFGVIADYSSYGSWQSDNAYLNLPLSQQQDYGMANCLVIDYVVRSEVAF